MLLKAKKRAHENSSNIKDAYDYSDMKKELHPDTTYKNKNYSNTKNGFSLKDKFK